jgi:hypothetical protein
MCSSKPDDVFPSGEEDWNDFLQNEVGPSCIQYRMEESQLKERGLSIGNGAMVHVRVALKVHVIP